ncbi:uncharacterized protein IWZ02DRAFT_489632 [Phyllosticta citriasiana]|uniref:Uncharacterized protein n=1 Tax=Phyllosticta citriasiana TaxID=595635 RepID=A0ABR1KPG6_9PEZI
MHARILPPVFLRPARFAFSPLARRYRTSAKLQTPRVAVTGFRPLHQPIVARRGAQIQSFSSKRTADEVVDDIQELYATARDEFEIAAEETEGNTVYAADDRAAAREALDKLKEKYESVVKGTDSSVADEVRQRVGQRIRELDNAVVALEEQATQGD